MSLIRPFHTRIFRIGQNTLLNLASPPPPLTLVKTYPPRVKSQTQTTSSASRKPHHKINNKSLIHAYFIRSINFNRRGHHYHVALFAPIASIPCSLCMTSIALLLQNHLKNIKCFNLHTKKHGNIYTCKTITTIGEGRG